MIRTATRLGLAIAALQLGAQPIAPARASELTVPPAGYAYRETTGCPFPTVVYAACEDQMQRLGKGLAAAKADGKLLLIVIGADWCPWCRALEKILPTDKVLGRKDALFDFTSTYAYINIATSAVVNGKRQPVPSGEAAQAFVMSRAEGKIGRAIPYLIIVDPRSGKVVHSGAAHLEDTWNIEGGHDPAKVRELLRAAHEKLRPAS